MKTITIQIGNSDNKLTQQQWSGYVESIQKVIEKRVEILNMTEVQFFGGPPNWAPWQNVAWVINTTDYQLDKLQAAIVMVRKHFKQESVAWTEGVTTFI